MSTRQMIWNSHLEGGPFFWQAGPVGVQLCHGLTATTAEVRLLAEILHKHGYTISAPLLPGHYTRPKDLNRVTWQDWYACVSEDYNHLASRCERVIVGGESTGALLALLLASEHPEIAAVLAYAPALKLQMSFTGEMRLRLLSLLVPHTPKTNLNSGTPWQGYMVNPLKGVLQLLRLQRQVRKALVNIHQPVLVIQGRKDATVHPALPVIIMENIPSSVKQSHWMESSGHVVILEQELDQVATLTLKFLETV